MKSIDKKENRQYTVHMIGNAHIDPVWLWCLEEGREEVKNTCKSALERMKETPEFIFTGSSAVTYKWLEEDTPKIFQQIRKRVKEGRWNIVGGWWIQPDCNIPCGESFVRQGLYGKRYFRKKFGIEVKAGYNVDSFGHCATLPQILKKSGMDYYVFFRPDPNEKTLPQIFWWESPDGSRVLACRPPLHYGYGPEALEAKDIEERTMAVYEQTLPFLRDVLCFYGVGNHGGGPTMRNIETIKRLDSRRDCPNVKFSTLDKFFSTILSQTNNFPVIKDELQYHSRGCYTVLSEVKKHNRRIENLLMATEKFSSLSYVLFGYTYPQADITKAWQNVLFNQFHDILAGTCIKPAYDDVWAMYKEARLLDERSLYGSLNTIARRIDTRPNSKMGIVDSKDRGVIPLIVFNPLAWQREDMVEAKIVLKQQPAFIQLIDNKGEEIPMQITRVEKAKGKSEINFIFIAQIPSLGYRLYQLIYRGNGGWAGNNPKIVTGKNQFLKVTSTTMENEFFYLRLDPVSGGVVSIFDKARRVEILSGRANLPMVIEDNSDTWSHGVNRFRKEIGRFRIKDNLELIEQGPVRTLIRVRSKYMDSSVRQDIMLYRGLPRIDFHMEVDWQEKHKMLKVSFPLNISNSKATYEIPYGNITRPATGDEEPGQSWIDVSGSIQDASSTTQVPYGVSLLNNCKYGFDIQGSEMRMSVVRSPIYASCDVLETEDPNKTYLYTDQGLQSLEYSLLPHYGNWQQAGTVRKGYEFNNPLLVLSEPIHEGNLPSEYSFIQIEPENVVLTVVKKAEDSGDLILRFYEAWGKDVVARINFPKLRFSQDVSFGHYEIKTLKLPIGLDGITACETNLLEDDVESELPRGKPRGNSLAVQIGTPRRFGRR